MNKASRTPIEVIIWRLFACAILAIGINSFVAAFLTGASFYATEGGSEIVLAVILFSVFPRMGVKQVNSPNATSESD
jgi:hypothetical protein